MADDSALRQDLLTRIAARRAGVQAFLRRNGPRTARRTTITIVLSSLAALFTAAPAVGGTTFSESVARALGLTSDTPVWRLLCLAALLVSLGAAVLTNLNRSQDVVARLGAAQAADAELEGLSALVHYGQVPLGDAVKLYQQYLAKVAFIPEAPVAGFASLGHGAAPGSPGPAAGAVPPSGAYPPPPPRG